MNEQRTDGQPRGVLPRRRLIRDASLLAGGAAAAGVLGTSALASPAANGKPVITLHQVATPGVGTPAPAASPVDLDNYSPVALTPAQLATLQSVLDRVFPKDDTDPGANEIGVFVYIDRALSGRYADSLSAYQDGLKALDAAAGSGGFAGLDADAQDALLEQAEAGTVSDLPDGFFSTLLQHTREGLFSDPMYGGNANFAGWDLIGYPGIKLVWTAEDQAVGPAPKPEHISVAQYGGKAS